MGKIREKVLGWLKKYKFLVLGLAAVFLVAFAFTYPGRCIIAKLTIEYYDFRLGPEDFKNIPFDGSSFEGLDPEAEAAAKECISRLGLQMSKMTIAELGNMGAGVVPLLVEAIGIGNAPTRYQAALALGLIRHPESFGPLVSTLVDPEERVRMAGAIALGNLGDGRAEEYLVKCLKVDDKWARFAAARALVHLGSFMGLVTLSGLADDPDVGAEAERLIAEYWKGNSNTEPLIDTGEPVPACILNFRKKGGLFQN